MSGIVQREWNLGTCRESADGTYGCTIKIPKCSAGSVHVGLAIHRENALIPEVQTMKLRIQNMESHATECLGKHLEPNESFEIDIKANYWKNSRGEHSGGADVGSFNMIDGSMKVRIDILSGRPKGATITIVALASEGL
jgi:hypothetical protein